MPVTRPYFVTFKGSRHLVESGDPAKAVQHVAGDDITELRAARASEVTAWIRNGWRVEVAGEKVAAVEPDNAASGEAEFTADDARGWIVEQYSGDFVAGQRELALEVFDAVVVKGMMYGDQLRALCEGVPNFADLIIAGTRVPEPVNADNLIALGLIPMGVEVLVGYIADRKEHELWALDQPGGKPPVGEASDRGEPEAE